MFDCIRSCWNSEVQAQFVREQSVMTAGMEAVEQGRARLIQQAISSALRNLEFTGPSEEDFQAYLPFQDSPGLYTIPLEKKENAWIRMMTNTKRMSCLAVMSSRCLEYYHSDAKGVIARSCTSQIVDENEQNAHNSDMTGHRRNEADRQRRAQQSRSTFLHTRIELNPSDRSIDVNRRNPEGTVRLYEGNKIHLGDLGTLEIIRDGAIQLAVLKSGKIERFRSTLDGSLVHKELLDPCQTSGYLVELCITS